MATTISGTSGVTFPAGGVGNPAGAVVGTTDTQTPIVLMGYYNPIYSRGVDRFLADAKSAGIDGLIVVDLPPEEDSELCIPAQAADVCAEFGVPHEVRIVSAHRTPLDMAEYGRTARERGILLEIFLVLAPLPTGY